MGEGESLATPSPSRRTALVVDDDRSMRRTIARILMDSFEIEETDSGSAALERLTAETSLVVLDCQMPGLTGRETLERLRGAGFETPVVMVSAIMDARLAGELLAAGANRCLNKLELFDRLLAEAYALLGR
ncbi:MAG: response regulator [Deltaproteobacteria bacterium]